MTRLEDASLTWEWVLLPTVGGFIGWITNLIAVRMLFRPYSAVCIPLLGLKVQGVLPRRHAELARIIGETVERELLSSETLVEALRSSDYRSKILRSVEQHLQRRVDGALPRFLPDAVQSSIIRFVTDWVKREVDSLLNHVEANLAEQLRDEISIASLVEKRILSLDLAQLEALVLRVASTELRYIELFGGLLGATIGFLQAGLLTLVGRIG